MYGDLGLAPGECDVLRARARVPVLCLPPWSVHRRTLQTVTTTPSWNAQTVRPAHCLMEAATSTNKPLLFRMAMRGKIPVLWFLTTNSFSSRSKYPLSVAPSPLPILTIIKIPLLHSSRETSSGHLRLFNPLEIWAY